MIAILSGAQLVSLNDFEKSVEEELGRSITPQGNQGQNDAVTSHPTESLFVVAGPGSGKTTALALRVLKLILVDGQDPGSMLITTFTKKAAKELSSRILSWGDRLCEYFLTHQEYSQYAGYISSIELNKMRIGTLDSIVEEALTDFRAPGSAAPVVVEDFVSRAFMINHAIIQRGEHNNPNLRLYLGNLGGDTRFPSVREMSGLLLDMRQRFSHDQSDMQRYSADPHDLGRRAASEAIIAYLDLLRNRDIHDFARLEEEFLVRIRSGSLDRMLDEIKFIMVDEYQDTNLLQEQIYFELAQRAIQNGGSLAVVGDEDQSLFRFRGATLDLFVNYPARMTSQFQIVPRTIYLSKNYRSTSRIIDFFNQFLALDQQYQVTRVPNKPIIASATATPAAQNFPILGMFRDDAHTLAADLALFMHNVIDGNGVQVTDLTGRNFTIQVDQQRGGPGDIAILFSSPEEMDRMGRPRLPSLLRTELSRMNPPRAVYNPRGQNLSDVFEVRVLCGSLLECLDPLAAIQNRLVVPIHDADVLNSWRTTAIQYANTNPAPNAHVRMIDFIRSWQNKTPIPAGNWDAKEVPLLSLAYKLLTWIPNMQNDIEGLVRMEAICRTISQAALVSNFQGNVVVDPFDPQLSERSVREALYNIFVPLATNSIEINEDLLDTLPTDRVNVMSIHQAKGLEFPLVVVDVGSDFRGNYWKQNFKRYPRNGGKTCRLEDEIRPHSQLGVSQRSPRDRAFDDLQRLYFEAFSRARDVLLLVGLNTVANGLPNVATGWDRAGNWHWGNGLPNLLHA